MLFGRSFVGVVWNVKFHEFVQPTESVAKRCIFNSFFICNHVVVECFQTINRVNEEVTIAGDLAHWIVEQCDLHDLR